MLHSFISGDSNGTLQVSIVLYRRTTAPCFFLSIPHVLWKMNHSHYADCTVIGFAKSFSVFVLFLALGFFDVLTWARLSAFPWQISVLVSIRDQDSTFPSYTHSFLEAAGTKAASFSKRASPALPYYCQLLSRSEGDSFFHRTVSKLL